MSEDYLKFRVWDKKNKCYAEEMTDDSFILNHHGILLIVHYNSVSGQDVLLWPDDYGKDRYLVERCTGLRDKTRELIYAGDVVLLDTGREKLVHAVKWVQGKFVLINEKGDVDGLVWSGDSRSVIGNIHEANVAKGCCGGSI